MSKFHIKKISEIDQNKLKDFYSNTFKFEKSIQEHYSWRYRLGYNNFEPIVLLVNDEICGHAGLIPANIKIDNNAISKKTLCFICCRINLFRNFSDKKKSRHVA